MPDFRYLTVLESGRYIWKTVPANSSASLERELLNAGIPVLEIRSVERNQAASLRRPQDQEKLLFLEQLETAFEVGMPLTRALEMGATHLKRGPLREALDAICQDVSSGLSLSKAMQRWPRVFSGLELALVTAGEEAGIMPKALQQINRSLARSVKLRQMMRSLFLYPKIVGVVLVLVLGVLLGFTLPNFQKIFASSNVPLPKVTELLLQVSALFSRHPLLLVGCVLGGLSAMGAMPALLRATPSLHGLLLKMPVLGPILRKSLCATFCRTFSQLLSANIPVLQALQLTRDVSWNATYRRCVAEACLHISGGRSLSSSMEAMRPVLGTEVLAMISFGEKTGSLSQLLDPLTDRLDRELTLLVERSKPVLESAVTVGIALVIGFVVTAAVLPTFDMVKVFSN